MTRAIQHHGCCPHCNHRVETFTPFSNWLRGLQTPLDSSRISNHNLDYIWHNYRENWLITIEEKQHGAVCTFAQNDTHGIVAQMLQASSGMSVRTARGQVKPIEYRGHYVIRFEKTTPDDGWTEINGARSSKEQLLALLRSGGIAPLRLAA